MAAHQHDKTATALWSHFQSVINRVEAVFPNYRKQMKGVEWGGLYGRLKDESLDPEGLEADVVRLMIDDDVTKKAGIYPYLLTGEEKHLNIAGLLRCHEAEGVRDSRRHLQVMREGV